MESFSLFIRCEQKFSLSLSLLLPVQPVVCDLIIILVRLEANISTVQLHRGDQRRATAAEGIQNDLPWHGGQFDQQLHELQWLLCGVESGIIRMCL